MGVTHVPSLMVEVLATDRLIDSRRREFLGLQDGSSDPKLKRNETQPPLQQAPWKLQHSDGYRDACWGR